MSGVKDAAEELAANAFKVERRTAASIARAARDLTEHTPPRYIVGVSTVLRQAAQFVPAVEKAMHAFRFAYWGKTLHPESWLADKLLKAKALELKALLEAAAKRAGNVDKTAEAAIRSEIRNVENATAWLPSRGAPAFVPLPTTKLGRLESFLYSKAAHQDVAFDPLRKALARWQDAASGFDADGLAAASDELCVNLRAISTRKAATKKLGQSREYVKAVRSATKALSKNLPDEEALRMLGQLGLAVSDLLKAQRAAGLAKRILFWRYLSPAIEASPDAWGRLGRKIASLEPVNLADTEKVKSLQTRIRAALAEAVGTATPQYRAALGRSIRRAELLAATLNTHSARAGAPQAWKTLKPNAALYAPGVSGKAGKLFVDDAVLVVNDAIKPRKAYLVFIGQVKAGDASSKKAVAQLIDDQRRLFSGSLTVGAIEYEMVGPTDLAWVQRAFVGTTRPGSAQKLTGLVEHIDAPLDAAALDELALAWLVRCGKVVP